jgi:hypothetical protein
MTTNRLQASTTPTYEPKMTARDWANLAWEKNLPEHFKAWDKRARELGQ